MQLLHGGSLYVVAARWSREQLLREVVLAPRRAFVPLAGTRVIERPGWLQLITPSVPRGGFNDVAYSCLADDEADAVIDATIGEYARLGLEFRWFVGPDSGPADLADRLARRGLVRHEVSGMACEIQAFDVPPVNPNVAVEQVDVGTEPEFSRVTALGWKMDEPALGAYHRHVLGQPERGHIMFLGRLDSEPAGTASYVAGAHSAYLMGGVVLPAFRGRGLYRALVHARLEHARTRGISLVTCQAGRMSAPILERLGFETVCPFLVFTRT
jgi:GNAT superfamily N-acetyltransferase